MMRRIATTFLSLVPPRSLPTRFPFHKYPLYRFSLPKDMTPTVISSEDITIDASTTKLGSEQFDFYRTEGGISILQKVQGVKSETGQLYVLSFRCDQCNTASIKSFTKHSYHKGVVLVKCNGCKGVHLVADNLGWFQDEKTNIETMYKDQVKKVHDRVAIKQFLEKAFEEKSELKQEKKDEIKTISKGDD